MRAHLRTAGVTHARLFTDDATQMPIGFRSWRDTGITCLALASVDVVKMQRRAGHDTIQTTMGYVRAAEDVSGAAGSPFPELPRNLVWPNDWTSSSAEDHVFRPEMVPAQGFDSRCTESTKWTECSESRRASTGPGGHTRTEVPAQGFEPR